MKKKCTSKKIAYDELSCTAPCTERKKCNNCKILRLREGSVGHERTLDFINKCYNGHSCTSPCTERKRCANCKNFLLGEGSIGTSGFIRSNEAYDFDEKTMTCTVSSLPNLTESLKRRPVSDSIESVRSSMDVSFVAEAPGGSEVEICKSSSGNKAN